MSSPGQSPSTLLHATCVAFGERGVLLVGPSGAGKSDLALRLIDQVGRGVGGEEIACSLVSDDQVVLTQRDGTVLASAPQAISGLLEVRGLGVIGPINITAEAEVVLVLRLVDSAAVERMPDFGTQVVHILGVAIPEVCLCAKEASAPAKARSALQIIQKNAQIVGFPDQSPA